MTTSATTSATTPAASAVFPASIAAFRPQPPDADWETIRARVMARLAHPAPPAWTDHNAADPGVTLAEAAAFGLADLHYRTATRTAARWPMEQAAWEADGDRSWHAGVPAGTATGIAGALAGDVGSGRTMGQVLEPLVAAAACRDDARALLAAAPWAAALAGLPLDAVIDLLRARVVRRVAHEASHLVGRAVTVARARGGTPDEVDARAAADVGRDLPLWPDEVARLVRRERRARTAAVVAARAAEVLAAGTEAQLSAVRALLAGDGLTSAEVDAAIALHPAPPGVRPELWERTDADPSAPPIRAGETTIWPPHPLQALTCEPVTAEDYARLARGAPGVTRAWAVAGQLPGVAWDGRAVTAASSRPGTITLVVEPAATPSNPTAFLRGVLRAAVGSEVDRPHPTWQDDLSPLDPRRGICDEVGAALLRRCPVVVQATLVCDVGTDRAAIVAGARARISAHFAAGRPESRTTAGPGAGAGAPVGTPAVSGPWPRVDQPAEGWRPGESIRVTEVVQALLEDPAVLGVESLAFRVDGGAALPGSSGSVPLGPACVPVLADAQCLRVRLALQGGCADAQP